MKRMILLCVFCLVSIAAIADTSLSERVLKATAILYSQNGRGAINMACTATAFEATKTGYLFATAAHCIGDDEKGRGASTANNLFVTFDEENEKVLYRAEATEVGVQGAGDDFLVLSVNTKAKWPTVPLGDEAKINLADERSARIINAASPRGLGIQLFRGMVSKLHIDRPIVGDGIRWDGHMFVDVVSGPGSSGSAIVSEAQRAIVGFLLGVVGGEHVVVAPVSRFKAFRASWKAGTYPGASRLLK